MLILIGGGSASGKSTLAQSLASRLTGATLLALDDYLRTDLEVSGPFTSPDEHGARHPDVNHPAAYDWHRVTAAASTTSSDSILIVEGLFALTNEQLRQTATLTAYIHTPDDIRLGRKITRNFNQRGQDPTTTFTNYLTSGRPGHLTHVAPTAHLADVTLDGTQPTHDLVTTLLKRLPRWPLAAHGS